MNFVRRHPASLALAASLVALSASFGFADDNDISVFEYAKRQYDQGHLDLAKPLFLKELAAHPSNALANYLVARIILTQGGSKQDALAYLDKAYSSEPGSKVGLQAYAEASVLRDKVAAETEKQSAENIKKYFKRRFIMAHFNEAVKGYTTVYNSESTYHLCLKFVKWHFNYNPETMNINESDVTMKMQTSNGSNIGEPVVFQARAFWDPDDFDRLVVAGDAGREWAFTYTVYQGQEQVTVVYKRQFDTDNPSVSPRPYRNCLAER